MPKKTFLLLLLLILCFSSSRVLSQTPGGVTATKVFWYDPGTISASNGTGLNSWIPREGGATINSGGTAQPVYYAGTAATNFQPSISFVGTDLGTSNAYSYFSGSYALPSATHTAFAGYKRLENSIPYGVRIGSYGYAHAVRYTDNVYQNGQGGSNQWGLGVNSYPVNHAANGTLPVSIHYYTAPFSGGQNLYSIGQYNKYNVGTNWTPGQSVVAMGAVANGQQYIGQSGSRTSSTSSTNSGLMNSAAYTYFRIGGDFYYGMSGYGYEFLDFSSILSDVDQQKINTYYGIKYGITLWTAASNPVPNYLLSDGTTIWDATSNGGYAHFIAGLGRDAAGNLNQKQANAVDDYNYTTGYKQPVISAGTTVAPTNALNTATLIDKKFMVWGDNLASGTSAYNTTDQRLNRVWKVQNTNNFSQNLTLEIPVSGVAALTPPTGSNVYALLLSTDPNFTTNVNMLHLTLTADANVTTSENVLKASIPATNAIVASNNYYFTFGVVPSTALPISILNFKAMEKNCDVELTWHSDRATNFKHFEIQVSEDAVTFSTVATINYEDQLDDYSRSLPLSIASKFVRLKLVDQDYQYSYSSILKLNTTECEIHTAPQFYPSPINNILNIVGMNTLSKNISVSTVSGKIVYQEKTALAALAINTTEWPAGTYFIQINFGNNMVSKHQVVKR